MEIDISIDFLTDCLICRETGEIQDTEYHLVTTTITTADALYMKKNGWKFDWSIPHQKGYDIYELLLKGSAEVQGMIACKLSWEAGNEGYVQFTAKSDLVGHYQETLHAHCIDWHTMYIDSYGAIDLMNKYFQEGE